MKRGKVLISGGDGLLLGCVKSLLSHRGIEVLVANNGVEALKIARGTEIAVLVTDRMMPVMNGAELIGGMSKISPDTVCIMISSCTELPPVRFALDRCGVFRVISKPWKGKELIQAVQDGTRRYRVMRQMREEQELIKSLPFAVND